MIINAYYDNKYIEIIKNGKKYYIMLGYLFIGLSVIYFIKKNPDDGKNLIKHATTMVKYMPLDKTSTDFLTPVLDHSSKLLNENTNNEIYRDYTVNNNNNNNNNNNKKQKPVKRSVSEAKKKYVAGSQGWRCAKCKEQLKPWFEVDHIIRLEYGGSNDINNLEALCRDCHGEKTAKENLNIL